MLEGAQCSDVGELLQDQPAELAGVRRRKRGDEMPRRRRFVTRASGRLVTLIVTVFLTSPRGDIAAAIQAEAAERL
jgi:hypothetical protein